MKDILFLVFLSLILSVMYIIAGYLIYYKMGYVLDEDPSLLEWTVSLMTLLSHSTVLQPRYAPPLTTFRELLLACLSIILSAMHTLLAGYIIILKATINIIKFNYASRLIFAP